MRKNEAGGFLICLGLMIFFTLLCPVFLSSTNLAGMLRGLSYTGIAAIGMAFCLISGTIDLSIGAVAALSSVVFALLSRQGVVVAVVGALACGVMAGLLNGWLITYFSITPFVTTLCSMYMIRGVATWISNGYSIYPLPAGYAEFGSAQPGGISWAFWFFLILLILASILLDRTIFGLMVRAVGSDIDSARCTEINPEQIYRWVFVISGFCGSVAGIMVSLILNAGIATVGSGWELTAITACVIGGISLFGYHGSFVGLGIGLLILQVLQNGIIMIGVSPYVQNIVIGTLLLLAMISEVQRRKYFNLDSL